MLYVVTMMLKMVVSISVLSNDTTILRILKINIFSYWVLAPPSFNSIYL